MFALIGYAVVIALTVYGSIEFYKKYRRANARPEETCSCDDDIWYSDEELSPPSDNELPDDDWFANVYPPHYGEPEPSPVKAPRKPRKTTKKTTTKKTTKKSTASKKKKGTK